MSYFANILVFICIYGILAISLNLTIGFAGIFNLTHAAFFGIGAYTSALLTLTGVPFWLSFICAFLIAAIFGFLISLPATRLKGIYLAIVTFGFAEIIIAVMKNWQGLTRGPLGLPGIPKASLFGFKFASTWEFFVLAAVVLIITYVIISKIVNSPFGRTMRAIRDDEIAAKALGKNVMKYKSYAMLIGAGFAGIAGSLFAHYITFIDPSSFTLTELILMLSMIVVGGIASVPGALLGAAILVILPEPLRFLYLPSSIVAAIRQMLFSGILIAMLLFKPNGILGERRLLLKKNAKSSWFIKKLWRG
ncbi:branched-chain amino acid ABC transporter permease [Candidatus Woesearchaeota archaeon]|nr:MAG: branched-chain amino acid ABC transporter permease [Candidatus Woesearchaeota archaeon]